MGQTIPYTYFLKSTKANTTTFAYRSRKTARVTPTARTEIAALLYKDDDRTPAQRHVYTFPRSGPTDGCEKPRFVPIWSVLYESLQFPLLFYSGEPGWSPGWHGGGAQDGMATTGNAAHSLPLENQFIFFNTVGNGCFASQLSKLFQH